MTPRTERRTSWRLGRGDDRVRLCALGDAGTGLERHTRSGAGSGQYPGAVAALQPADRPADGRSGCSAVVPGVDVDPARASGAERRDDVQAWRRETDHRWPVRCMVQRAGAVFTRAQAWHDPQTGDRLHLSGSRRLRSGSRRAWLRTGAGRGRQRTGQRADVSSGCHARGVHPRSECSVRSVSGQVFHGARQPHDGMPSPPACRRPSENIEYTVSAMASPKKSRADDGAITPLSRREFGALTVSAMAAPFALSGRAIGEPAHLRDGRHRPHQEEHRRRMEAGHVRHHQGRRSRNRRLGCRHHGDRVHERAAAGGRCRCEPRHHHRAHVLRAGRCSHTARGPRRWTRGPAASRHAAAIGSGLHRQECLHREARPRRLPVEPALAASPARSVRDGPGLCARLEQTHRGAR